MRRFQKVRDKIVDLLGDKRFLIVVSIIVAFGLWCFVALTVNTEGYSIIRDVPINVTKGNFESDLSVISQSHDTVDVVVYGSRSVVGVLKKEDFSVKADFSNITVSGEYDLSLSVSPVSPTTSYKISSVSQSSIIVKLDKMITKEIEIKTELIGATVDEGFVVQTPLLSQNTVKLTGPETEVNSVATCKAVVVVNGNLNENKDYTVKLEFYSEDGRKLTLKESTADAEEITVTLSVLKEKEVKIKFSYTNVPKGFNTNTLSYKLSQNTIKIAGQSSSVDDLTEINIGYIDVSKLDLNGKAEIQVTLPKGIVNLEEIETVTVSFNFNGYMQKSFRTEDIRVVSIPLKYNVTAVTKYISNVRVLGKAEAVSALTSDNIVAEIDIASLGDITVGTQTVPVKIIVPSADGVFAVGEYTATINISVKEN